MPAKKTPRYEQNAAAEVVTSANTFLTMSAPSTPPCGDIAKAPVRKAASRDDIFSAIDGVESFETYPEKERSKVRWDPNMITSFTNDLILSFTTSYLLSRR